MTEPAGPIEPTARTASPVPTGVTRRPMTPAERRAAAPRFPWFDVALAPLNGLLAAVPAVVLAGLPLYLAMWLAGVDEPGRWASFVGVGAFGLAMAAALYTSIAAFLRARERVDDDLLDDEVDDLVAEVNEAIGIVTEPPVMYLRFVNGDTVTLRGDYVAQLRHEGHFPSTVVRLVRLPQSRAVVGVRPLGEPLVAAFVSGKDHHPTEVDGHPAEIDFDRLRAMAT